MNIKLNPKMIKEMCGTISFKKGESFYRAGKVCFENVGLNSCNAIVMGKEDFYVKLEKDVNGELHAKCSCPELSSYKKSCQHVAAVLLAIYDQKRRGTFPGENGPEPSLNLELTEGLMTLFDRQIKRSSGHQHHFENRQVLDASFTLKPVTVGIEQNLFGIELSIGTILVENIRDFLIRVETGDSARLFGSEIYDPNRHCFQNETNAVIRELIQVVHDELVYGNALQGGVGNTASSHTLILSPSSWERLTPLFTKAPRVKIIYNGNTFDGFRESSGVLPLQFNLLKMDGKNDYILEIEGLKQIIVFQAYKFVLFQGEMIRLENERLIELKQLLEAASENYIPIPENKINYFLEKVVPGLRNLGDVHITKAITNKLLKTPLIAKLYLDRDRHRLLAGLEFHYENIVINPLESEKAQASFILIRDTKKEEAILQLMDESLFTKTDSGYYLHNEELEYDFLYNQVSKLQRLVQVYATTAVRNRIIRGSTHPRISVRMKKERTNWLEFKFEMEGIPEQQIREILTALEEKRKYYRLPSGSLLPLSTREFEEINRFLSAVPDQNEALLRSLNFPVIRGLQLMDTTEDSHVFILEASFREFLEKLHNPDSQSFDVPKSLVPILRDYQKQGYQWMKTLASFGFGGVLADDMGLGKTLQSIAYILSELPNIIDKKQPVLIVCPSSVTYNWHSEIMKFAPEIRAIVVDGSKKERTTIQKNLGNQDVVITSYPLLRRDISWYEKQSFHTAFFDEAQSFKNPVTQTARAVKKIQADHRFALTGTPIENSLSELWSIFHVVFPELFLGLKEYSHLTRKKIARRIHPFMLRRMKEDVLLELPEKNVSMESVELLPEQKKLYAAYLAKLRHDTFKHLDKDTFRKNRIKILAGLTRLRQICCHPALFVDGYKGSSAKLEQLIQIVKESRLSGRRVLIFSQFTEMLKIIGKSFTALGLHYFYLDGKTPIEERMERVNRFNIGERDLFLISLKAGGTGLNLTGADTVILYDLWWNPAVETQAADRAHRMGQTNIVQVIKLIARGTIEEKINQLQEKKRYLIEEMIDSNETSTQALTEEDIREILRV